MKLTVIMKKKSPGWGIAFLKRHPTYYSFVGEEKTIRALTLKVFPFKIIYEISGEELYVFAIHHYSRNDDHFLNRF